MTAENNHAREFLKKFAYLSAAGSALLLTSCAPMPVYGAPPVGETAKVEQEAAPVEEVTAPQKPYLRPQARYGVQVIRPRPKVDNSEKKDT